MGLFIVFRDGVRETKTPTSIRRLLFEYKTQRKVLETDEDAQWVLVDEDDDHVPLILVWSRSGFVSELENVGDMIRRSGRYSGWI